MVNILDIFLIWLHTPMTLFQFELTNIILRSTILLKIIKRIAQINDKRS